MTSSTQQEGHGATCDCGCMGLGPAFARLMDNIGPKEAREHFRTARVEFLKGMRAVLDVRIEQMSREPKTGSAGTTVPVE